VRTIWATAQKRRISLKFLPIPGSPGDTEAHTAMLANALVERGHEVTLFAKEGSVTRARMYPLVP
jgi:hypothetical protein